MSTETTVAHTKGPWDSQGYVVVGDDFKTIITSTVHGTAAAQVARANARLIAAAPELLDACLGVVMAMNGRVHSRAALNALECCRAAIAKAEGK